MRKVLLIFSLLLILAGATSCQKKEKDEIVKINHSIDLFVENYLSNYLKVDEENFIIDSYVLCSVKLLQDNGYKIKISDYIDKDVVLKHYEDMYLDESFNIETANIADYFKAAMCYNVLELDNSKIKNVFDSLVKVDSWNYAYALMALDYMESNEKLQEDIMKEMCVFTENDFRDADYAGSCLMALSNFNPTTNGFTLQPLYNLIEESLSKDGIQSWGNANSCSTSVSILGLLANGIDPTSKKYSIENENLITALLKYENNGAFKYLLSDEIVDEKFSTPQCFASIVCYKIFEKNNKSINLFDYE